MALLKLPKKPEIHEESNPIAEAERLGKVEIDYTTFGEKRQVRIEMGKWGKMRCQVWGTGNTIDAACRQAIDRARVVSQWFPHPDDC